MDRAMLERWLRAGIAAADAETATASALIDDGRPATVVAIGKAAAAMARGAARVLGDVEGICVTNHPAEVPPGVALVMGDHPVPGDRSFAAGRAVLDLVGNVEGRLLALISGGGSALCESPIDGISNHFVTEVNRLLLKSGASIVEANLVRAHLSAVKGGGVSRVSSVPMETLVVSDVAGAGPEVVASGPTLPMRFDPETASALMERYGIAVDDDVREAISRPRGPVSSVDARVVADGNTALESIAALAWAASIPVRVETSWLTSSVTESLEHFLGSGAPGLNLAVGEPTLRVDGDGRGGRNTHAALLAASMIEGSQSLFAALATDGDDGSSGSAGAIVDGDTSTRGGDPVPSMRQFDSASYLRRCGDLLVTGPTGTNVGDLWALWR